MLYKTYKLEFMSLFANNDIVTRVFNGIYIKIPSHFKQYLSIELSSVVSEV